MLQRQVKKRVRGDQDNRVLLALTRTELIEGQAGDGVEAGDAVDGDAAGMSYDPGRHQPGTQPGEGCRPCGRDDGIERALQSGYFRDRLGHHALR